MKPADKPNKPAFRKFALFFNDGAHDTAEGESIAAVARKAEKQTEDGRHLVMVIPMDCPVMPIPGGPPMLAMVCNNRVRTT